jgi:hypothetical protein
MNTLYGIRGNIKPELKDLKNDFLYDDIFSIHIDSGLFEIGFEKSTDKERAYKIGETFIQSFNSRTGLKLEVDFNGSWKPDIKGNRVSNFSLSDSVGISDRQKITTTVQIKGMAYIVKPEYDSYNFSNDIEMVLKAEKDETLSKALKYYSEEVLGDDKPLYGIYKALEEMTKKLSGAKELAKLVGESEKFVSEIKQTAQSTRHARTSAPKVLSESECRARIQRLLNAYAKTL